MDGNAIIWGLASTPGPDWLRDVVPTFGLRLRVYQSLQTLLASDQISSCAGIDNRSNSMAIVQVYAC